MSTFPVAATQPTQPSPSFPRALTGTILIVAWAVLSYAAAFRSFGIGRDYLEYLFFYERIPIFLSTSVQRFEIGFSFFAWIFRYVIDVDYGWFALFFVSIALGIKFYLFWKYLKYPVLASVYYGITFYPIHEYTQIRTAVALSLGYLALHLAYARNYMWASLSLVVGVTFHTSAFFLLPIYLLAIYGRRYFVVLTVGGVLTLGLMLWTPFRDTAVDLFSGLNPLLGAYAENREMQEISVFSVNNFALLAAMGLGLAGGWLNESRYHSLFMIVSLGAVLAVIGLAGIPMVAQRMKEVFYVATVFLAHRSRLEAKTMPAVGLLWATGGLLFYLNLQSDVLAG